ncbi:MAG: hypothetical protein SGARI_001778, partial [Bacillariaceae sp.]
MAPWRTRFNKVDRFQKLDDNDHGDEDDDVYQRHEITPMSSGVMLSSEPTTISTSSYNLEKKALLQTPNNRNSAKPLNAMSSPETTSTVMTTPRASPVSISSNSSQDSSHQSHPDSTVAMVGTGQRKSVMELDDLIQNTVVPKKKLSDPTMSPLKNAARDDELVEIYEAEDSSTSYADD